MTLRPPLLSGLSTIAESYDCAICDVWGVLHNGREAFLPAANAMRKFRAERGPVVLLSNAPRLADGVVAQFDRLALPQDFYDAIVTAGTVARADLLQRTAGGRTLRVFYLGPPRDNPLFAGLNLRLTDVDEAEIVLCTGLYNDDTETPEDYRSILERFKARALPFLCANPDLVVQRGDRLIYCAGSIARLYESMGGEVVYFGKPHPPVFEAALAEARRFGPALRPLVVGDGLDTDITGANRMGLDALFIACGIHRSEWDGDISSVERLFARSGAMACGVMPALVW